MFEYLTQLVEKSKLQAFLTQRGQDGWRLHTCDEMLNGLGAGQILVVLDRIAERPVEEEAEKRDEPEAMACKG